MHLNLHPGNVLLAQCDDVQGVRVVIANLGRAESTISYIPGYKVDFSVIHNPYHRAPEILFGGRAHLCRPPLQQCQYCYPEDTNQLAFPCDIWAMGCLFVRAVCGFNAFPCGIPLCESSNQCGRPVDDCLAVVVGLLLERGRPAAGVVHKQGWSKFFSNPSMQLAKECMAKSQGKPMICNKALCPLSFQESPLGRQVANVDVSKDLAHIIETMLEYDPAQRASAQSVAEALQKL